MYSADHILALKICENLNLIQSALLHDMLANKTLCFLLTLTFLRPAGRCLTGYFSYPVASSGGHERDWEQKFPVTSSTTEIWGSPFRRCGIL